MDFTAIDFETANRHRDSACQLAAVRVRGGVIVDKAMWMIRPTPMYFAPGNIRVHGITPDRVASEPTFGECWPDISRKLDGEIIIAHNASFDMGVLRACLMTHRCDIPEMSYGCTRAVARRAWPHRQKFGLKPLSNWLGVEFRHHDALEDSIACAKILLAAAADSRATSMEDLESKLNLTRGSAGDWGMSGPSASRRSRRSSSSRGGGPVGYRPGKVADASAAYEVPPTQDLQRLIIRAEFIQPLRGKTICLAGKMKQLSCEQTIDLIGRLGGEHTAELAEQTSVLVIGTKNAESRAVRDAARAINEAGGSIEIVDETDFLGLIVAVPV